MDKYLNFESFQFALFDSVDLFYVHEISKKIAKMRNFDDVILKKDLQNIYHANFTKNARR